MKIINTKYNCHCSICKNKLPFKFPKEIIEAALNNNLIIFAGAGISTESKQVFKYTLTEELYSELKISKEAILDFPNLVTKYCQQNNGRQKFLHLLRRRFDYIHQYPELYELSTRFHKELAPLWMIKTIVTTNWDDYFENECGAIPIVTPKDFAFYNLPGRKVFKIHGSINNYGSIIASKEDYTKCYNNLKSGIIGSYLKTILATKVVLFVGYSFRDFNFNKIYSYLKKELKEILPKCYIVTLDDPKDKKFYNFNSTIMKTDAAYFLSRLREHFIKNGFVLEDSFLTFINASKEILTSLQDGLLLKFRNMVEQPGLVYTIAYQDGLKHGFEFITHNAKTGKSYNILDMLSMLENEIKEIRPKLMKAKAYWDVSYLDGFISGLSSIFVKKPKDVNKIDFLYIYGYGRIKSLKEFYKKLNKLKDDHKSIYNFAKYITNKSFENDPEIILRHRPFL
jgi:NAD-dependent SIR2 family protein deacetylase